MKIKYIIAFALSIVLGVMVCCKALERILAKHKDNASVHSPPHPAPLFGGTNTTLPSSSMWE